MKAYLKKALSMILAIVLLCTGSLASFAESAGSRANGQRTAGELVQFGRDVTWAQAGRQVAGMLGYIVEDAAQIDLTAHSARIAGLNLEDESVYLAILAENGYLADAPAQIDPAAGISADEYMQLLESAFPTVVSAQEDIDALSGEEGPGNIAIMGDGLVLSTMLTGRIAVTAAQQLKLTAVNAPALSLNAGSSVFLSESEIGRVHINDTAAEDEQDGGADLIYLHIDPGTEIPEVIVKSAEEVLIEGSGALGIVRVQEQVGKLTVRATGSVVNETEAEMELTGPDAQTVLLQPGEQVDFVLSKWLVSFVTEGTPVETQAIAPGGTVNFAEAVTEMEGKIFTAWYEDADFTQPVSRLGSVDRQTTLYARFIDASEAVVVRFETFGGRELEPLVFARGEYLLTKPVESLYTSKEGYSFGGWCTDEECTSSFGYTEPIEESMTLYAMYSSYEQEVREDPGTIAEIELADGAQSIALTLPAGMSAEEAAAGFGVESATGAVVPEIAVRKTESGAELYCEAGFTPGTSFTLYAPEGVRFAGQPEYIDTLTVSIFREQVEIVEFAEGLTYVLWDEVSEYTPVSETDIEYNIEYAQDGTEYNMMEDHDAEGSVVPGRLVLTGGAQIEPEQIVVFYDGEINDDEATIDSWEGGDLAGHVLFAEISSITDNGDGTREVTFRYAEPEDYITALDVHTTEEVNIEEMLTQEQIAQVEKAIASQLASNDELKAQMLVAVMTSEDTQRILDEEYGPGTYSLASVTPVITDPMLDINVSAKDSTATASIGVGVTVSLYGAEGLLVRLTPYLFFEEQLTLDINVDGGFLWIDMSVIFKTKSTMRLELKASTGGEINVLDEAKTTLEEILNADGTATEGYDYQEAANKLMNVMQQLSAAELNYQDLFAVKLLKIKKSFKGIITFGINVELRGQAAVIATFGVEVMAEYGQKVGFNYNFLKIKGGSYKQKLPSEVTTNVYLIGKIGARLGITITFYIKMCQAVTVSTSGGIFAYVELAGMFMYTYALSAGGGNYVGALYLEVGVDIEIWLTLSAKVNLGLFTLSYGKNWMVWNHRWKLYSMSRGMTMSIVQNKELDEMWAAAMVDASYKTSYPFLYIPLKSYDMLDASCTERELLFDTLQDGSVTAKLTLENIEINGQPVHSGDPRISVISVGDGTGGRRHGVLYADELLAAKHKVESYECDVLLTYENRNKSELIKLHEQVFPFAREFKMATTIVNVDIMLYDWCAHAWGIEEAEWNNEIVFETTFEDTHVLGCPVEPSATGTIDPDAVIAAVKAQYPELGDATLSWFNPTLNSVSRTVEHSVPRISNLCFMTPESGTIRYDVFETTNAYDLTFYLYASRYPGYNGEITYIIESSEALEEAELSVRGSETAPAMAFSPVMSGEDSWSLTALRSDFDGTARPIMLSLNGGEPVKSNLTINGREKGDVVVLKLGGLSARLSVINLGGIDLWGCLSHKTSDFSSIKPGEKVTLFTTLTDGYQGLRAVSQPEGLEFTVDGNIVSFTMPAHDVQVKLYGVSYSYVNFMYNHGDLGVYGKYRTQSNSAVTPPAEPVIEGLTFAGWYTNPECEGEPFDFSQKLTGYYTLYADWRVNVGVDFGGAKGQAAYAAGYRYEEIDGEQIEIVDTELVFPGDESEYGSFTYSMLKPGDTALQIILPNYDGYEFFGWYLTPDFSGEPVDPVEYVLSGSVTFYARWERIVMLTYELNYGEQEEPYAIAREYALMPLRSIPAEPQREHYEFLGWFRSQDCIETEQIVLDEYIAEGTMTLYAGWAPMEYAISYELGGGENAPGNPVCYNIESGDIIFGEPTRTGYHFTGWEMEGIEDPNGDGYIPAGSSGDVVMIANWEPIVYAISYELVRGETAGPNPTEYTIESGDIVLSEPAADGYEFTGWTGTDLAEPTFGVVIPAGSTGDRSYKANWNTTDPILQIIDAALAAIPDEYAADVDSFGGIEDILAEIEGYIAADETCADYIDQLSAALSQNGEAADDGSAISYGISVTVSFTDDEGNITAGSKEVTLTVMKNPVEISAAVAYPEGLRYIPYGTSLADVALSGCTATSNGEPIEGSFAWAEPESVPLGKDNGIEMYEIVFTPADSAKYSTASMLVAVDTQIGLGIRMDAPDVEYMAEELDPLSIQYYAVDIATGEKAEDVSIDVVSATISQSQITPGTGISVALTDIDCTISSSDDLLYAIVDKQASDTITISRAVPQISGTTEYKAGFGATLRSIEIALTAVNGNSSEGIPVEGVFEWADSAAVLNSPGVYLYTILFTPDEMDLYDVVSIEVTVNLSKRTVQIPVIESVIYNGQHHIAEVPVSEYYSVISNEGGTYARTYPVTLSLADKDAYCWAGTETSDDIVLDFVISPRELSVSGTPTVMQLAYGQLLNFNAGEKSTERFKSAKDMISGVTVTDTLTGEMVIGEWVWDVAKYLQPLNASAKGDDEDFGDGYELPAIFVPTMDRRENYAVLRQYFLVEIVRVVPEVNNCNGYIRAGEIYQPANATAVNQLKDYPPVLENQPNTPLMLDAVYGSLSWEEPERYPETSANYNAVFKPNAMRVYPDERNGLKIDGEYTTGKNHKNVLVPIYLEIKHEVEIDISIDGGSELLYDSETPSGNLVSRRILNRAPGNVRVALSLNDNGTELYISEITVGFLNVDTTWGYINTYSINGGSHFCSGEAHPGMFKLNTIQTVDGSFGVYDIVFGGDANKNWNKKDIFIEFKLEPIPEMNAANSRAVMSVATPLAGADLPTTNEPTVVPTEAPAVEPTAEPTEVPAAEPIAEPTEAPDMEPTAEPTEAPAAEPTAVPTEAPAVESTAVPTEAPAAEPTAAPTEAPAVEPTAEPTEAPAAEVAEPIAEPTEVPAAEVAEPTAEPTEVPAAEPTVVPTEEPAAEPTEGAGESAEEQDAAGEAQ